MAVTSTPKTTTSTSGGTTEKGLLREASRTARGTESSRPADRVLRMARGREVLEGSASRSDAQRTRRDPRRDLADRGFLREPFTFVHGSAVRRRQGERGGVPRQGHDLLGAAVRHRRVRERRDRRDQVPDRLHGRLPDDDEQGHLHHQRHRACRRLAAGPLPGRLLRPDARQDGRQGGLLRQGDPVPWCLARVRHRQARHHRCPHRPQASSAGHRAAEGAGLGHRAHPRAVRLVAGPAGHPGEGPHRRHRRGAAGHLPQAASGRAADKGIRAGPAGEPVLQGQALRPRQGRSVQAEQEARPELADLGRHADRGRPDLDRRVPAASAPRARSPGPSVARTCRSRPTTSTTSATVACAPWAS